MAKPDKIVGMLLQSRFTYSGIGGNEKDCALANHQCEHARAEENGEASWVSDSRPTSHQYSSEHDFPLKPIESLKLEQINGG